MRTTELLSFVSGAKCRWSRLVLKGEEKNVLFVMNKRYSQHHHHTSSFIVSKKENLQQLCSSKVEANKKATKNMAIDITMVPQSSLGDDQC